MFTGYFTEGPYQDPESGYFGRTGRPIDDLSLSNGSYDSDLAADLYDRYFEEKLYAEEMGFDGLNLNEHHSTPFTMRGVMNIEAAALAKMTKRSKLVLLGNILPIWDDPLWLAEQLAIIDVWSRGRLINGWVRGTGRESIAHNAQPPYNWERFQEAHDFIIKTWTEPGPFRWEGQHYQYRYVNPWAMPYQKPHPPIWIPGLMSRSTVAWAAERRYPYIMFGTELPAARQVNDYYQEVARESGYEAGTQNIGYLMKVHVDETEELADATARKFVEGPSNPFLEGNQGIVRKFIQNLPGLNPRRNLLPTAQTTSAATSRGIETGPPKKADNLGTYDDQVARYTIIRGTPDTVISQIRHVLEYVRPGSVFFWDGDGAMDHDDAMRSLRLFGSDVLPAIREIGKELELFSPFERDPATGEKVAEATEAPV